MTSDTIPNLYIALFTRENSIFEKEMSSLRANILSPFCLQAKVITLIEGILSPIFFSFATVAGEGHHEQKLRVPHFPLSRAKGHQSALGFKAPLGTPRYRLGRDDLRQSSVGISAKKKEPHSDKEPPHVYCSSRHHVISLYPRFRLFTLVDD